MNGNGVGVNDKRRVECKASKHHGFHALDEKCPYCEVKEPVKQKPLPRSFDSEGCYIDDILAEYLNRLA